MRHARALLPGTSYRLLDRLGQGQAEVYLAHDVALGTYCVVKLLTDSSSMAMERFQFEARTQAKFSHPHIAKVLTYGASNGRPYIVSEALHGVTLAERLRRGEIPLEQVLTFTVQVLEGVAAAHRKNLMHRDLKPGNIFLATEEDGPESVKILDFGFARRTPHGDPDSDRPPSTDPRYYVGTLGYVAPEALMEGGEGDARADLFSVGAVLYEMLSGKPPFRRSSAQEIMQATLSDDPTPALTERRVESALRQPTGASPAPSPSPPPDSSIGRSTKRSKTGKWRSAPSSRHTQKITSACSADSEARRRCCASSGTRTSYPCTTWA